ncbi:MAG: hypothetical protein V2B18_04630 [Pseudomonadota bacterium]
MTSDTNNTTTTARTTPRQRKTQTSAGHRDSGRDAYDNALDVGPAVEGENRGTSEVPEVTRGPMKFMDPKAVKTHPHFVDMLPVEQGLREAITESMRVNGFFTSHPIVLGTWPGQEEPVLIDGHTRRLAALDASIAQLPFVVVEFTNEIGALQHAVSLQTKRRVTTDAALYRMCEKYDKLLARGGDRRSEEAKSKMPRGTDDQGCSSSARETARLIGCNYRKVDKIRRIRRDGWPEIQESVRNDKLTINKAYKMIRDEELGTEAEQSKNELSPTQINALKPVLSEGNLADLHAMGTDLGALVNLAVEQFVKRSREAERPSMDDGPKIRRESTE